MKEPVITLTLEEYEELRKEHECLEKEHAELQRKYEASLQEYSRQVEEISACTAVIADLRWKLADLTRRLWGKSSEKRHLPEDAGQLSICFESPSDVNDPVAEEQKTAGKSVTSENGYNRSRKSFTKKITPHARKPIDPSLPREEIIIPMPEGLSLEGATKLGEEVSEQYAVSPARFYVKRIIRPKYRLADGRIITAPMPVMAHPHSNASESVLAHIATAKYYDHLPLHRQLDIFEREGIHLSPSTVSNWMMAAAQRLEPIYNELRELVKDSYYVMADETPHPVLESDRPGALHRGYMWNFYLPRFHTPFFEYHKGRGSSGIDTLLAGQVRVVQSDGFAVYDKFDTLPGKLHLCCWAHVRRNFVEAEGNDPPRARHALGQIGGLYAVEEKIRMEHLEGEAVVKLRREKSYPIIKELEKWCKEEYGHTVDKSPIAKAMFYMYTRFERKYSINSLVYWVTYVHNVVYSFYRSMIYCYINSTQRCAGSIVIDIIPTNGADKRKFFPFAPYFPVTNVIKRYFYPYFPAIIGIKGYSFPYFPYLSGIMKIKTALYSLFSRLDWHKTVVFPCLGEIYEGIRSLSWEIPVT